MKPSILFVLILLGLSATCAISQTQQSTSSPAVSTVWKRDLPSNQPVEVGLVQWGRDFESSLQESKETGKPVLALFQEVPGCSGCQKFGREVLSQPLLVEAIENEFIPVVVYNNRPTGSDAALLKRFKEPAWNYQVIRFFDSNSRDIIPRRDHVWSTPAVAARMIESLKLAKRPVPKYLESITEVSNTKQQDVAAFAMSCFWTGEYELGKIDGVVATEAGWFDGREVTLVHFNKDKLSLNSLAKQAAKVRCAQKMYTTGGKRVPGIATGKLDESFRPASNSDQNRQLTRWRQLTQVPHLNETQLTKLNALAPRNMSQALDWLSPGQRAWLTAETR